MSAARPEKLIGDMRGVRYGEVLAVYLRDHGLEAEVFGTQLLNDCPQELWETLDAQTIAADMGALLVKLNGPRYWTIDGLGAKGRPVEPELRDFNGITMRRIAVVQLGPEPKLGPYTIAKVDRRAIFFLDAGRTVHELVDPDGLAYVMQALCVGVDPTMSAGSLDTLGERLDMPPGWSYRSRVLDEDLVIDTTATLATVVQDEFENSYTLPH
ncbi:MAG: hypothetical protein FGM58_09485 [Acidimicrobiia bacterium]|nr:hypothetical protein [Acidimicrobiia bacterium]